MHELALQMKSCGSITYKVIEMRKSCGTRSSCIHVFKNVRWCVALMCRVFNFKEFLLNGNWVAVDVIISMTCMLIRYFVKS